MDAPEDPPEDPPIIVISSDDEDDEEEPEHEPGFGGWLDEGDDFEEDPEEILDDDGDADSDASVVTVVELVLMYDGKVVDTSIPFLTLYIQYDELICTYAIVNTMMVRPRRTIPVNLPEPDFATIVVNLQRQLLEQQQETNRLREQIAQMNQRPQVNEVPPPVYQAPPAAPQVPEVQPEIPRNAEIPMAQVGG
ncbi:hypothetical protein TIFTF001_046836 [Ficus carica]|uniref:Uncharacterized protein n=1 Tax=Ficus carica TaxID=3494 RepID=A0AA88CJI2_FICCA|nr:hypothetical protein TIFTF001_046836 [Ficus carica]